MFVVDEVGKGGELFMPAKLSGLIERFKEERQGLGNTIVQSKELTGEKR